MYGSDVQERTERWEKNVFLLDANERETRVTEVAKILEKSDAGDPFRGPAPSAESYAKKARAMVPEAAGLFFLEEPDPQGGGGKVPFAYHIAKFGNSIARVPFVWDYLGKNYDMQFLAGFCGVSYNPETELLRAEIGWGVRDPQAGDLEEQDIWEEFSQNVHGSGRPAKRK